MSENSFKVPAKKKSGDSPAPDKKDAKTTQSGKAPRKSSPSTVKALPAPKEKPSIEETRVKSSGRLKPGVQPDAPDMGNLTQKERMEKVLGTSGKKDSKPKSDTSSRVSQDTIRKELSKKQEKKSDAGSEAKTSSRSRQRKSGQVSIPPVGHRNRKKKGIFSPDIKYVLTVLVIFVIFLLLAAVIRYSSARDKAASAITLTSENYSQSADAPSEVILEIRSGMGASEVAAKVGEVTDSSAFLAYLEANGLAGSLQIGTYRVPAGISAESLARALTTKDTSSVTVYAGMTIAEIDRMLVNRGLAGGGEFTAAADSIATAEGLAFAEGWLLSGVYSFTSAEGLAADMHSAMLALLRENASLVAASDLSVNDIVILSSMINRETQDEGQMKIIAGVLLARIAADMPLGVDATTRYELDDWTGDISQRVYDTITPYNTRRKKGLPPSGIGSPSEAAVLSVLSPARTSDLYYLHDDEGRLYTSATYEQHLETYERVH